MQRSASDRVLDEISVPACNDERSALVGHLKTAGHRHGKELLNAAGVLVRGINDHYGLLFTRAFRSELSQRSAMQKFR